MRKSYFQEGRVDDKLLIKKAFEIRENSYSPYSHFKVGAALLSSSGKVYLGCNIENSSFTPTICAERVAFSKAISEGEKNFSKIAVVGSSDEDDFSITPPCGVCRQFMSEFVDMEDFEIILATSEDRYEKYTLSEIFPLVFKL